MKKDKKKGEVWARIGGCLFLVGVICILLVCILGNVLQNTMVDTMLSGLAVISIIGCIVAFIMAVRLSPELNIPAEFQYVDPLDKQEVGYHGNFRA